MRKKDLYVKILFSIVSLTLFFLAWDILALNDPRSILPRPMEIFVTLFHILATNERSLAAGGYSMSEHITSSLMRVFFGFFLAAAVAIPIGLLSGWSFYMESLTKPIVELLRPIPPFAWIPFAIIFFDSPFDSVFIVYLGAFFPILLTTIAGVKAVDSFLVDAAKTLGANRAQLFRKVVVPASIPQIMTGIRIGLGIGWMTLIAAELVGVKGGGLGIYIHSMSEIGRYEKVFAGMFLIGILGFLMVTTVSYAERWLSRWAGIL